jgi:hypothetical protein
VSAGPRPREYDVEGSDRGDADPNSRAGAGGEAGFFDVKKIQTDRKQRELVASLGIGSRSPDDAGFFVLDRQFGRGHGHLARVVNMAVQVARGLAECGCQREQYDKSRLI